MEIGRIVWLGASKESWSEEKNNSLEMSRIWYSERKP